MSLQLNSKSKNKTDYKGRFPLGGVLVPPEWLKVFRADVNCNCRYMAIASRQTYMSPKVLLCNSSNSSGQTYEKMSLLVTVLIKRWRLHSFDFAFGLASCGCRQRQMCAMCGGLRILFFCAVAVF